MEGSPPWWFWWLSFYLIFFIFPLLLFPHFLIIWWLIWCPTSDSVLMVAMFGSWEITCGFFSRWQMRQALWKIVLDSSDRSMISIGGGKIEEFTACFLGFNLGHMFHADSLLEVLGRQPSFENFTVSACVLRFMGKSGVFCTMFRWDVSYQAVTQCSYPCCTIC